MSILWNDLWRIRLQHRALHYRMAVMPCQLVTRAKNDWPLLFPSWQLPLFPLHCTFPWQFSCSAPSCLLNDPWSHAGSWELIGQGYTHSVAGLPTKIRREFMQMHSLNVTWPPLFINTHRSLSLNYKAALGTIHVAFGGDADKTVSALI